jgi:hypothetical protein
LDKREPALFMLNGKTKRNYIINLWDAERRKQGVVENLPRAFDDESQMQEMSKD